MDAHAAAVLLDALEGAAEVVVRRSMVARSSRCRRSQEVRSCRSGRSSMTRPSRSIAMRFSTWNEPPVPAPLFSSASSNSGMGGDAGAAADQFDRRALEDVDSQPIRRRNAAVNRPDIEPPTMTARRLRRLDDAMEDPEMDAPE